MSDLGYEDKEKAEDKKKAEDDDEDCRYYMDSNLDWSFVNVRPHVISLLQADYNYFLKKNVPSELSKNNQKSNLQVGNVSSSKSKRSRLNYVHYNNMDTAFKGLDTWNFNIFDVIPLVGNHVMVPLAKKILVSHGLLKKFNISSDLCDEFLLKVEKHYRHNPFHNSVHAADVMQTVNCIMVQTGFINTLNDLELLCVLLTALMHDIEHTGTNNNFHRNSRSDMARLYLTSILENHHLRVSLGLLRLHGILVSLTGTQYEEFKDMLCSMILSTDMSNHFLLVTNMKIIRDSPINCTSRIRIRRVMMMLLHAADISNPAKPWECHKVWVSLLCQEYFDQGDREKKMKLPISPNCDKLTVNIAALQIGFVQTFARETYNVLYSLIKRETMAANVPFTHFEPWVNCMDDNSTRWNKNWSSLKYDFINELLSDTTNPRNSVMGDRRKKKKKKCFRWLCCSCEKRERQLFHLAPEYSTTSAM